MTHATRRARADRSTAWQRAWPLARHWLYWTHRWLGIGGCLLFVMWFVSGVVMMYVGYPTLTEGERLAGLRALDVGQARVSPPAALEALPEAARQQPPRRVALEMQGGAQPQPVWRIVDARGGRHAVSARDTTRSERFWNWLGSVPHWIYFTPLRADPPLWHDVVVWLSAACIGSAVTGIVIGILRLRLRRRFRNGAVTPYTGWMAWHHIAGLVGGFFVLTWIVSGWLSMNPNRWFERNPVDAAAVARYTGGEISTFPWPPAMPPAGEGAAAPREALLQWFDGRPLLQLRDAQARVRVLDAASGAPASIAREDIVRAAARLRPGATASQAVLQTAYDFHWYGHHRERVLPVWRLEFDDPARTRLYIDPANGQLAGSSDRNARLRRWLFNAAHSLDFPWLIQYRPAWDLVMWLLSIVGAVASASGVVIGWRRLRPRTRSPTVALARP